VTAAFAAAMLLAGPPRFLGPPEKKPPEGEAAAVSPGDPAPSFGGKVENAEAAGVDRVELEALSAGAKLVLISFFSAASEACRRELPVLQHLSTEYKGRGLRVVGVALERDAGPVLKENHVGYPVVEDPDQRIARQYLGDALRFPSLVIVDGGRKVVAVKKGYAADPATFLPAQVDALLR